MGEKVQRQQHLRKLLQMATIQAKKLKFDKAELSPFSARQKLKFNKADRMFFQLQQLIFRTF